MEYRCFAIWYPVLGKLRDHSKNLTNDIRRLNIPMLQVELCIEEQEDVLVCVALECSS